MKTPTDIATEINKGLNRDIFYDADMYKDQSAADAIFDFQDACAKSAAILTQLDTPDDWFVVVTDEDGNRVDSETFGGDYSIEHIREMAGNHFGDLPAGHNCRFYPVGPERVDLAFGFSADIPTPRYAVDGKEYDDDDSPLTGDGAFGPFEIFDIEAQAWLPGKYAERSGAQQVADLLNNK